ncbi:polynucleotide kinase-phosphatase [Nakamurella flava]|uniref:Polynucleotide kinase-phosphatase n=1 Tax=Nakamurella flava TaxID=2576308 RepID=A0A4U6QAK1_9ACTN|nr:polynucleotide kinase-phosphatase [Nakamurella flava]TKV56970.1 polynucleotide kinase-phosphatase [Nakamurella flava]
MNRTAPGRGSTPEPSDPTVLTVPEVALIILIGVTGSGKSSFARRLFRPTEIVSSDACRAMVADDENDQDATAAAFELVNTIVGLRLAAGRLTVVDATSVQPAARASLLAVAKAHDVLPIAVVLDLPMDDLLTRHAARTDRPFGADVVRRQHDQLRRGMKQRGGLSGEGFRGVHFLRSAAAVDAVTTVRRERLRTDRRDETGPFDVIGDVHGCRAELETLLDRLGYAITRDEDGRAVDAAHPTRRAVFVGDLVDRGPDTPGVLRLVMGMVAAGHALCVAGNHEDKLARALAGRKVTVSHGLAESLDQLRVESAELQAEVRTFLDGLISHYVLDGGRLAVAHAGVLERYQNRASKRVREFCLYGQVDGTRDDYGLPVRGDWARDYRGRATVLYGHTPVAAPTWVNDTMCLDTGCVFGGHLTALRYPERELVAVPALAVHHEPSRPFPVHPGLRPMDAPEVVPIEAPDLVPPVEAVTESALPVDQAPAERRDPQDLHIGDVLGNRGVHTRYAGRVKVRTEQAAAALEVMSRFAIDPRALVYLPPTMSPVTTSSRPGLLEHPDEAFATFREAGVGQVVAEEKHMGSRATLLIGAAKGALTERFGVPDGAVWTRTGRSFFGPERTALLVDRMRAAAERAGLFAELGTSWLVLDAEILPWSVKAEPLIREQYASVAAAAGVALPASVAALEQAAAAGLDVGDLLDRTRRRVEDVAGFRDAYRRYRADTDPDRLGGVGVAVFQVLAAEGATFADRPHAWHLDVADRLVATDPELGVRTDRRVVDLADPESAAAAVTWWEEMTTAGGEGMVVKPAGNLTRTPDGRRLVQPGLKVRGPEYLRLIYGPEYRQPANLERLRSRQVGAKRSLALREYAIGLEGLDRLVAGEPLWRVHQCAFAVLALESEPVDPRL